jgi:hypothetical protein
MRAPERSGWYDRAGLRSAGPQKTFEIFGFRKQVYSEALLHLGVDEVQIFETRL